MSAPLDRWQKLGDSLESHAHRLAKDLMVTWLRNAAAISGHDGYAGFGGISWRVNRGEPHFGIHAEIPVLSNGTGILPVWDEVNFDPEAPEDQWRCCPPTYRELVGRGDYPESVIDIGIQHKGAVIYAIEIEYKHPCTAEKIVFLRRHILCDILIIPAYWVLGQVSVPTEIPREFWVS